MYATMQASERLIAASRSLLGDPSEPGTSPGLELLRDQVCAEAGVWAPEAAGRALRQARGDIARAVTLVRVWAATLPPQRADACTDAGIRVTRRVSAAFAEIPGGQWLGASPDFASRLLDWCEEGADDAPVPGPAEPSKLGTGNGQPSSGAPARTELGRVSALLRSSPGIRVASAREPEDGLDQFDQPLGPHPAREARQAALGRGETGALVALANVALTGRREAVAGELCVGVAELSVSHPRTGRAVRIADVPISEATVLSDAEVDGAVGFALGFGVSAGRLERRALATAVIDATLEGGGEVGGLSELPALAAVDGLATSGFVDHLRLPHFASFASYVDRVRPSEEAR
ncbi:MAG: carbon-phosphorus lyase complex subunit PhnI [Solirubrobacterales bacterium]